MRKTKIVCTLGPSSSDEKTMEAMLKAGMNVVRLNFSHGTHEEHQRTIERFRRVRDRLGLPAAVLLDTKGPEIRTGNFARGEEILADGQTFTLTTEEIAGDQERVSVTYKKLPQELTAGDTVLINDGKIVIRVTDTTATEVTGTVVHGGRISNHKGINLPNVNLSMQYISPQDREDLLFGIRNDVDYVAASFVRSAGDVQEIRKLLDENGGREIKVIAKIESTQGIENFEEILDAADGIMVARGDLGVEVPYEELPQIQKMLIDKCRRAGKRCITATEMLESMISQPRPTRAEISDVANAVYDGTSAVMLSGETAGGKYPVQAVEAMARICLETEKNLSNKYDDKDVSILSPIDALSHSACVLAEDIGAKAIVVCSRSGGTARKVSRFRPTIDIIGMTIEPQSYRKLALSWGVTPVLSEEFTSMDVLFYHAKRAAIDTGIVQKGDRIVITGGNPNGKSGNSNVINIEQI